MNYEDIGNYDARPVWQRRYDEDRELMRHMYPIDPYRVECKWWSAHLAYGNRLPGADAGTWLDTVEAWSLCVNRLGCAEAWDEVDRLRKEAGR